MNTETVLFDFCLRKRLSGFELAADLQSDCPHLAVVGRSGSGKSLALQLIAGLTAADGGHIRFRGQNWQGLPPPRRRCGLVFQDYALFPHLTVAQNIAFGRYGGWRNPPARPDAETSRWLETMQLDGLADAYPHRLSGGQRQRTALARALITRPQLLLLDEPFSALDGGLRRQMRREVAAVLAESAVPLMLITHDPEDAEVLAKQVWRMEQGRLKCES